MQKFITGLFSLMAVPVMLLNIFGGIISGIWLAFLGEWRLIGIGILSLFVAHFLLAIAIMPQLAFMAPAMMLVEKKKLVLASIVTIPAVIYGVAVMAAWCYFVFMKANGFADESNLLPVLIWSYGIATGPWNYMAGQEAKGGGGEMSLIYAGLISVAYIVMISMRYFFDAPDSQCLIGLLAVMGFALIVNMVVMISGLLSSEPAA